jgi:hypothetical protein
MIFSENRFPPPDRFRGQAFSGSCSRSLDPVRLPSATAAAEKAYCHAAGKAARAQSLSIEAIVALALWWSMIFSENRFLVFRIMP